MINAELENTILGAVADLFDLAEKCTWNKLSRNCKFILSEIRDTQLNVFDQIAMRNKQNRTKKALPLHDVLPSLGTLNGKLFDINLYVWKATKSDTVIDIRYYLKTSLDTTYRQKVIENTAMVHCKVSVPPWLDDAGVKFDINWELKPQLIKWKIFLRKMKWKIEES